MCRRTLLIPLILLSLTMVSCRSTSELPGLEIAPTKQIDKPCPADALADVKDLPVAPDVTMFLPPTQAEPFVKWLAVSLRNQIEEEHARLKAIHDECVKQSVTP